MLKCIASLFSIYVIAFPSPERYCIQYIYHAPPSANGGFKVATKTSGGINIKISSPSELTSPSGISRSEAPVGLPWCPFNIPLPPNTSSFGFLICTYFEYKCTRKLRSSFVGIFLYPWPQPSHMKFLPHAERLVVEVFPKH